MDGKWLLTSSLCGFPSNMVQLLPSLLPSQTPTGSGKTSCTMCTSSLLSSFPNPEAKMALLLWGQALNENFTAAGQALSMPLDWCCSQSKLPCWFARPQQLQAEQGGTCFGGALLLLQHWLLQGYEKKFRGSVSLWKAPVNNPKPQQALGEP